MLKVTFHLGVMKITIAKYYRVDSSKVYCGVFYLLAGFACSVVASFHAKSQFSLL